MSYSRRQLYAFGEPLGNSATRNKVGGGRIYGGGGGGDIISDVVDPVVNVVESVAAPVVNVVEQVGQAAVKVVETAATTVANTAQAIVNDPTKALPLIAVAVLAPELAPLLEVSTATAGAIINTGIQLASGADPTQVAENFATSMATGSLGITTGTAVTDRMLVGGVNAAINGQDVSTGVGAALGNYAVNSAVSSGASEAKGAISDSTVADNTNPATGQAYQGSDQGSTVSPSTAQDTTTANFSPEELNAINQGQADATASGPSPYAPTAGTTTSDQPAPLVPTGGSSVEVTSAPEDVPDTPIATPVDAFEDSSSPSGYTNNAGEPVNADGTPYSPLDAVAPTTEPTTSTDTTGGLPTTPTEPTTSTDTTGGLPTTPTDTTGGTPTDTTGGTPTDTTGGTPTDTTTTTTTPTNLSGVLGTTTDKNGYIVSTFDDGSTLTVDPATGEVVDFTEATDYVDPNQEETTSTGSGLGGIRIGSGLGKAGTKAQTVRKTPTSSSGQAGLTGLNAQYGSNLTPGYVTGDTNYSLFGLDSPQQEGMASGGSVQHMATGSTPSSSAGVYDLSTTASSPFLGGGNSDIMALKPGVVKGKVNYALPGYPFGQEFKLAAAGGAIANAPEGHNPEFFSEGGLGALQHTYLKGGGDGTSDSIPAMLANGEFVIPADVVSSLGNGSSDSGAKVLDEFLKTIRAHKRKADPKKLPPDSKGVKGYLLDAKKKVKK